MRPASIKSNKIYVSIYVTLFSRSSVNTFIPEFLK